MTNLISVKSGKKEKTPLMVLQQKFNRLKKKIQTIQAQGEENQEILNQAVVFYKEKLIPLRIKTRKRVEEYIKLIYSHSKKLKKKNKDMIFEFLSLQFNRLGALSSDPKLDEELKEIFKAVEGESFDDFMQEGFQDFKKDMEEMFTQEGMDLDLDDISFNGSQEEVLRQIFEKMGEQEGFFEKQKEKMEKKSIDNIENKDLRVMYKQLAKSIHPDLEQDLEEKLKKQDLMKKLTIAYENNDLYTLLQLETQIQNVELDQKYTIGQLTSYTEILKKQAAQLQKDILYMHQRPEYACLADYVLEGGAKVAQCLKKEEIQLKKELKDLDAVVQELKEGNVTKVIDTTLKEYQEIFELKKLLEIF